MSERRIGYFYAESPLHQMDALSKFIWVFISSTLPFAFWQPGQVGVQVIVLFALALSFSRQNLPSLLKAWLLFAVLGGAIMFFHLLTRHAGQEVWRWGVLAIHSDGVHFGTLYALRVMAIMSSSYSFVRTTSPRDLVVALVHVGVPYRYAWMIFLSLLSVPVFEAEVGIVREAQMMRGIRPAANPLLERLEMSRRYVLPLLVSALRRVENVAIAMDARAFGVYPRRTFIDRFQWSRRGLLFVGLWALVFLAALGMRVGAALGLFSLSVVLPGAL